MTSLPFLITIPKRNSQCTGHGETLSSGMTYYSLLVEAEEVTKREDYCEGCWEATQKHQLSHMQTHWKSKIPPRSGKEKGSKTEEELALNLLKESLSEQGKEAQSEAFVLALFLARKRYLYLRQQLKQENGKVINLYEVATTEEMIPVQKITLSELDVKRIQERLALKFSI